MRLGRLGLLATVLASGLVPAAAQMKTGKGMKNYNAVLRLGGKSDFNVILTKVSSPACIFHPGEKPVFTFQLQSRLDKPIRVGGKVDVLAYGTRGIPGDIWVPDVFLVRDPPDLPIDVDLPPKGFQDLTVRPKLPERKGGYALVIDLGKHGRALLATCVRTFKPASKRVQYPKQSLDYHPRAGAAFLERLGIQAVRVGVSFNGKAEVDDLAEQFRVLHDHKVTAVVEIGAGHAAQPLGRPRPHLTDDGRMRKTKSDMAWLPEMDDTYQKFVYNLARAYGWPKGPVTGFMLWNEPWEGISISGWGADMLRYREMYRRMGEAILKARKDAGVDVLVGGCDSSSNTWDKLFPDESDEFMKYLDFCSIHYQGLSAPVLYRKWNERKEHKGRVRIWDTESWVANTDDRIAGVVATNRASGYDRALGVFIGNVATTSNHGQREIRQVHVAGGKRQRVTVPLMTYPPAASIGAVQHFIGERAFREILFKNGLPWVYVFDGLDGRAEDGTVVVVGDIGALFDADAAMFRTVASGAEARDRLAAIRRLPAAGADERAKLIKRLAKYPPRRGGTMTLPASAGALYDFYGNRVEPQAGKIVIPLDDRGFFLRAEAGKTGAFARLVEAVRRARINGIQPLEIIARDPTAPIAAKPTLRLTCTNVLNRPVRGTLSVKLGELTVTAPGEVSFAAHETKPVDVAVTAGRARADNAYPLAVTFDAGADGSAGLYETMHVNLIARRTVRIDGRLDDWRGVLPQTIQAAGKATRTLTEAAWLPFEKFQPGKAGGTAVGYLAYDEKHFYFAAKIADDTKDAGTLRFETRDDAPFFYPEVCRNGDRELRWPKGVRRFSYRRGPILPSGNAPEFDNVLIAFNAIEPGADGWLTHLPGRMPKFTWYQCTDYEYALNTVAKAYGGGFEVWRMEVPGMSRKHFYPRQPKHPLEGPVKGAHMVTTHEGATRVTEVAIPWSELPHVRKLLDAGQCVKFSFKVNDNAAGPVLELAKGRSVSRRNNLAFHTDWCESWANEVEFAFEK